MSLFSKLIVGTAGLAAAVFILGFLIFATMATRGISKDTPTADGIVVLTGGEKRIWEAGRLLEGGKAKRLLVSGVNRITSKKDVRRLIRIEAKLFACCVDLGYEALNTRGNAEETRNWVRGHNFSSLIVVTSSYHMPRSLAELSHELPDVRLIAHPVVPTQFQTGPWWLNYGNARILAAEYIKFLPTAARYAVGLVVGSPSGDDGRSRHAVGSS